MMTGHVHVSLTSGLLPCSSVPFGFFVAFRCTLDTWPASISRRHHDAAFPQHTMHHDQMADQTYRALPAPPTSIYADRTRGTAQQQCSSYVAAQTLDQSIATRYYPSQVDARLLSCAPTRALSWAGQVTGDCYVWRSDMPEQWQASASNHVLEDTWRGMTGSTRLSSDQETLLTCSSLRGAGYHNECRSKLVAAGTTVKRPSYAPRSMDVCVWGGGERIPRPP